MQGCNREISGYFTDWAQAFFRKNMTRNQVDVDTQGFGGDDDDFPRLFGSVGPGAERTV